MNPETPTTPQTPVTPYNYQGAISAGAAPSDVINYLATQTGYNAQGALKAGANPNDVLKYMSNLPRTAQTPAPTATVTQPTTPNNSPQSQVAGDASDLATATASHAGNIVQDLSQKPSFTGATDVLGNVAGETGDIIGGLTKLAAQATMPKPVYDFVSNLLSKGVSAITSSNAGQNVSDEWNQLSAQYPNATKNVANLLGISALAVGADEGPTVSETGQTIKTGAQTAADMATAPFKAAASAVSDMLSPSDVDDLNTITNSIAPKMNTSEMKNAIDQGRVTRASQSGISQRLFGQAPDVVEQSDAVKQAAQTIQNNIPNAAKMNDTELYSALDDGIASKAQALKPAMQATPIDVNTLGKAQDAWNTLKAQQVDEVGASFDNMPGAAKMQSNFQNVMDSLNKGSRDEVTGAFKEGTANTMDDVWDARKAYDASIPKNVKSATSLSSDALQYKKAMWLQNRGILNDVINDTASGLGDTSKQAFSDMTDMYSAQQNILTKAPKPVEAGSGLIGKGGKFSAGRAALTAGKYIGGAWVGNGILHQFTGLP